MSNPEDDTRAVLQLAKQLKAVGAQLSNPPAQDRYGERSLGETVAVHAEALAKDAALVLFRMGYLP